MVKNIFIRFVNGFCYAIGITVLIHAMITCFTGTPPMLPEYAVHFNNELKAYMVELILIGVMSGITSAGTVVLEARKIGIIFQSILFMIILLAAWIPVACYVWGFHKYTGSMISTLLSLLFTFGLCRVIQYRHCKREIEEINAKLMKRKD